MTISPPATTTVKFRVAVWYAESFLVSFIVDGLTSVVSGGGIGGIVAAYALGRHPDIDVDVYEGASQFGEVGAGIAVIRRSWAVLTMLGLESDLLPLTNSPPSDNIGVHIV